MSNPLLERILGTAEFLFFRDGRPFTGTPHRDAKGRPFTCHTKRCGRCGGAGGSDAWKFTGWTCFECGGKGTKGLEEQRLFTTDQLTKLNATQAKKLATKTAKEEVKRIAADAAFAARRADFILQHGKLIERARPFIGKSAFVADIIRKSDLSATLSERQEIALRDTVARFEAQAKADTEAADVPITADRIQINGTVVSLKAPEEDQRFPAWKILVRTDAGFKLWGSLPSALHDIAKGDTVSFFATVERSPDDPKFGFFSRPTKACSARPAVNEALGIAQGSACTGAGPAS